MFFSDHGEFFDGDIHDADHGIHKWAFENSRPTIQSKVQDENSFVFTCVRNPYTRVLSAFFDKIAGIQRNGQRYRGNLVPMLMRKYGVDVEGEFDQIASFRRFLLFVRDSIRFNQPMDPGMREVLKHISMPHPVDMDNLPRFNESEGHGPKRAFPVEDYFDDLSQHLVWEIYKRDFDVFKYDRDPAIKAPVSEIDLEELHAKLRD